jgi:serine/threonine-protein kinase
MSAVLSIGQVLDGRYEILAPLAEGGMGAVYRARRMLLGDEVAIKVVRADQAGPGPLERFMRESRACARLRHPNIVSIFDFNADQPDRPFLVMELLNGSSIKQELETRGRLSVQEVQDIVPPLCAALHLAHRHGIVHRDLKPANIVGHEFAPGERVYKLVDFGLANIRESTDETRLTGPYQFVGTIAYASPEQLTGAVVDARSDIYSLGAVVFEMLTGRPPFEGQDPMSVLTGHLTEGAPRPSAVRPELPAWIDVAIGRALAKSPDDRWPDVAEFGRVIATGDGRRTTVPAGRVAAASGVLATYEIGERLGPGRLGSDVYRGTHRALGHPIAIRILRRAGLKNWEGARARFLREAKTLQLAHPSIIQVRDYGEEGDLVYLVTDFLQGPSLRELLHDGGPVAWPRLRVLLGQLVDAARALHRHGGLLCGLSPEIIRVVSDEDGERLMISTAGIWQAQDLLATLHDETLRGAGLADVELRYVAPELLIGRTADVRSDIFTMGVLTYEMATGTLPYDGRSMPELLGTMLRGAAVDPRTVQPRIPESAATALLKALREGVRRGPRVPLIPRFPHLWHRPPKFRRTGSDPAGTNSGGRGQTPRTSRDLNRNAKISASSSISFETGLPAPWPAFVSIRIRIGVASALASCSRAANFMAIPGKTRSSVSAVMISVGGYATPLATL